MVKFFKDLEQWEKYNPSSFWLFTICLWLTIKSFTFGALSPASEVPCQSQIVVGQLRAGGSSDRISILGRLAGFFIGKPNPRPRPQPQCPAKYPGPRFASDSDLIRGVTLALIHLRKMIFHLVVNGTLTRHYIVTMRTKTKIKTIKRPLKVNVDLEF